MLSVALAGAFFGSTAILFLVLRHNQQYSWKKSSLPKQMELTNPTLQIWVTWKIWCDCCKLCETINPELWKLKCSVKAYLQWTVKTEKVKNKLLWTKVFISQVKGLRNLLLWIAKLFKLNGFHLYNHILWSKFVTTAPS